MVLNCKQRVEEVQAKSFYIYSAHSGTRLFPKMFSFKSHQHFCHFNSQNIVKLSDLTNLQSLQAGEKKKKKTSGSVSLKD